MPKSNPVIANSFRFAGFTPFEPRIEKAEGHSIQDSFKSLNGTDAREVRVRQRSPARSRTKPRQPSRKASFAAGARDPRHARLPATGRASSPGHGSHPRHA